MPGVQDFHEDKIAERDMDLVTQNPIDSQRLLGAIQQMSKTKRRPSIPT